MKSKVKHPAKYPDDFIPIFAEKLKGYEKILDPMAGTGKIGNVKKYGFDGIVYVNDLELEWVRQSIDNGCDIFTVGDAAKLKFKDEYFDAICTSPTYGNRMADSHNAKDGSKRNTYTHTLGRKLHDENTGKMQWGEQYRKKHHEIYIELYRVLRKDGLLIINVKDHIRKGQVVEVSNFHKETILSKGFVLVEHLKIKSKGLGFGSNRDLRLDYENIYIFKK